MATVATAAIAVMTVPQASAQDYFIGQMFETAANFCPRGYAEANGQLLSIAQNTALFSLLGTTYGGNGQTTFALPDLRGRMAINQGQGPGLSPHTLGEIGGVRSRTLTILQLAQHTHEAAFQTVNAQGNERRSFRNAFGIAPDNQYSSVVQFDGALNANTLAIQRTGGADPVANMSPFIVMKHCIALEGIFPSRN
ncbi:phage tail protein [Sphingopyxis sp. PET50]|uniref:phage tail protein n=1 Tax=Sphingopyxis sp. PET50 TaxID=2976533 RepID=UPI0021AFCBB7|nr:tail fiber protein [Sphingopyxis sp. PET50]